MSDRYIIRTTGQTGPVDTTAQTQLTAHLADTNDAHDASAISFSATGNLSATDVQAAIAELDSEKAAVAEPIAAAHIADTSDAHDASAISVLDTAGNYTATDVEAVLAELPSRYAPIFGVKGYGAVGDGVTNDATAIQAAISAASAAGGGIVHFPVGVYAVGTAITVPAKVRLVGEGRSASQILAISPLSNGTNIVQLQGAYCGMQHLYVKGRLGHEMTAIGTTQNCTDSYIGDCEASHVCWGVYLLGGSGEGPKRVTVERVYVHDHNPSGGHMIELNDADYCVVRDCYLVGGGAADAGNGIELYLNTSGKLLGNQIVGNTIVDAGDAGIQCYGDAYTTLKDNRIITPRTQGIYTSKRVISAVDYPSKYGVAVGNVIIGANQENVSGGDAIYITGDSTAWTVKDNNVQAPVGDAGGTGGGGITIEAASCTVFGNVVVTAWTNGIRIGDSAARCQVVGNMVLDASAMGVGSRYGIDVSGDNCTVMANTSHDTRGTRRAVYAIRIASGADGSAVIGNKGTYGTGGLMWLDSGTNTTAWGNENETYMKLVGSGRVYSGTGTPEAAITAPVGSLYLRNNGGASTTLYIKESGTGNTGWIAK